MTNVITSLVTESWPKPGPRATCTGQRGRVHWTAQCTPAIMSPDSLARGPVVNILFLSSERVKQWSATSDEAHNVVRFKFVLHTVRPEV